MKRQRKRTQKHEIIGMLIKETGIKKCKRPKQNYLTHTQLNELLSFARLRNDEVFKNREQRLTAHGTEN